MKNSLLLIPVLLLVFGCMPNKDKAKEEIVAIEKAFAELAAEEGLSAAFVAYAAEDAVLLRNKKLIKGKENIKAYFDSNPPQKKESLSWEPEYVDVSNSGDMAYTYGPFTYSFEDENGETVEFKGVFHTVWKKQQDGSWKFVWD